MGKPEQRARVAHVELAALEERADRTRQLEQPQQIRDRCSRAADRPRCVLVREPELFDEPVQRARLLDRIQVLALDVLDQRDRDGRLVRDVAHDGRDRVQARELCGAPAALARDDLVTRLAVALRRQRPHDDRLDDALRFDRLGELRERVVAHVDARLVAAALEEVDGHLAERGLGRRRAALNRSRLCARGATSRPRC